MPVVDTKISLLPNASALASGHFVPVSQGSDTKKATVAQFRSLFGPDGAGNLVIGAPLAALTTGQSNTVAGDGAGAALTTGYFNALYGDAAGSLLTKGFQNTALGHNALQKSTGDPGGGAGTTSTNNTAIGANAGQQLTSGHRNTAVGVDALFVETTGIYNVGVGVHALNSQVGVSESTAVGTFALFTNVTGTQNTALGFQALYYGTAGGNTALGHLAAQLLTTGYNNVAIGPSAAAYPRFASANATTTGWDQVSIGAYSGQANATQVNDTVALGFYAVYGAVGATALGANAEALHSQSVALGQGVITTAASQVALSTRHIEMVEISDPAAGAANSARLYAKDNGSGKTQLVVRFASGAVQVIATEP